MTIVSARNEINKCVSLYIPVGQNFCMLISCSYGYCRLYDNSYTAVVLYIVDWLKYPMTS
jgi:hypothetical protein